MEWIADPTAWLGLGTLILLEIVLGIDNLIFIAISGRQATSFTAQPCPHRRVILGAPDAPSQCSQELAV